MSSSSAVFNSPVDCKLSTNFHASSFTISCSFRHFLPVLLISVFISLFNNVSFQLPLVLSYPLLDTVLTFQVPILEIFLGARRSDGDPSRHLMAISTSCHTTSYMLTLHSRQPHSHDFIQETASLSLHSVTLYCFLLLTGYSSYSFI